jgi:hypothetical protein
VGELIGVCNAIGHGADIQAMVEMRDGKRRKKRLT